MKIGNKKALGIITCMREGFYDEIIDTTPFGDIDKVFVFDSSPIGKKYATTTDLVEVLPYDARATIGFAKNRLMERMFSEGYDHIFLQEDDVSITDGDVFDAYIQTASEFGIWGTLCHAWSGIANFETDGMPKVKNSISVGDTNGVVFTQNRVAAFSYIHRNIIKAVGYHDEGYQNCWEHIDYYQTQSTKGLANHWGWFVDIADSRQYIRNIDNGFLESVIRHDAKWADAMRSGAEHFSSKFGCDPLKMPIATKDQVLSRTQYLIDNYSIGKK